jgi:hypothetical protein
MTDRMSRVSILASRKGSYKSEVTHGTIPSTCPRITPEAFQVDGIIPKHNNIEGYRGTTFDSLKPRSASLIIKYGCMSLPDDYESFVTRISHHKLSPVVYHDHPNQLIYSRIKSSDTDLGYVHRTGFVSPCVNFYRLAIL